jgi:hypothetical protein
MPFTPGHPKYGGRKQGRANTVTLKTRDELWAYIDQLCAQGQAANPFRLLVDLMVSDPEARVQCAIALADRLLPKLKAIELSGDPERPLAVQLTQEQRQARIAALLAKRQNGHTEGTP